MNKNQERESMPYPVDSDMVDPGSTDEEHNDEYIHDVNDLDDNNLDNHSEFYSENDSENGDDEDSLQRLSEQVRRRRMFENSFAAYDEEDDEDEDAEMDTAEFLRRFIQDRSRSSREDDMDDINGEQNDPRTDFLRAMGSLSGSTRGSSDRNQGFVDVVQRLMGGGIIIGGRDNSEMEGLINNLNQRDNVYLILETLNELSERLLMMNGITAERTIPSNQLAKCLVNIMEDPILAEELELHLVACRCLYNFIEVNQDFIHDALNNNAVESLCGKLLTITYIDLTEQALQTLEMISREPTSHNLIIKSNGLQACLQYMDFLTVHAQRKCLTIFANACTNISLSSFNLVKDVFDNISEVARNHNDSVVMENCWLAISRIIGSFKSKPEFLEDLFSNRESLLKEMTQIIFISCNKSSNTEETSKKPLKYSSCLSLIKSLTVLAGSSVKISCTLLQNCSIGDIIVKSLNKYSKAKMDIASLETIKSNSSIDNISIEALMAAPKELLLQFLSLIGNLLPLSLDYEETKSNSISQSFQSKLSINANRVELYKSLNESYWKFINDIWSLLINSFQATMDYEIRRQVLISLRRIFYYSTEKDYENIRGIEMVTGLLASVANQSKYSHKKFIKKEAEFSDIDIDDIEEGSTERANDFDVENNDEDIEEGIEVDDGNDNVEDKDKDEEEEEEEDDDNDNDDDDDGDGREEEEEEERELFISSNDTSEAKANLILLSTFLITHDIISKAPFMFIEDFERDGLINDTLTILETLQAASHKVMNSQVAKYIETKNAFEIEMVEQFSYGMNNEKILAQIVITGEKIEKIYSNLKSSDTTATVADYMKILQNIKTETDDLKLIESYNFKDWKSLWSNLRLALHGGDSKSQISSFELISSGIIESLAFIFTSDIFDFGFEFNDCYKAFVSVFFIEGVADSSVLFLVNKLQEALTRSESFDIVSVGGNSSLPSYQQENNYTASMARQVKLKLVPEGDGGLNLLPPNMQNMILSVHAIATFKSIDTFLKQRFNILDDLIGLSEDDSEIDEDISLSQNQSQSEKSNTHIEFLLNGEVIPNETTIYGAIYRSLQGKTTETVNTSRIWSSIHNISFRKVSSIVSRDNVSICYNPGTCENELDIYDKTTISILRFLKILFEMNTFVKNNLQNGEYISSEKFTNWKLAVKLNRQLEEPLVVASGTLPSWSIHVTKQFSFIYPLDTRIFFLQSTSFGYSRLIHHWQVRTNQEMEDNNNNSNSSIFNQRPQLGRPTRHKVRLSRKLILQSAMKVLSLYGSTPGILEIEYFDEVGSGLGPTLEFYSTVSKEFSKKKLKLWRDQDDNNKDEEAFVVNTTGLFPSPLDKNQVSSENGRKVLYFFGSLGKFIARALLDSRIIDFNFNPVFLKLVQYFNHHNNQKSSSRDVKKMANLPCLKVIDPELANSLEHLLKYVKQYATIDETSRDKITVDGATLEDLALSFVLPGYPDYELMPNGENIPITATNVELYINRVLEATLYTGIVNQTKAFMEGFSKVFPINSLAIFSPEELVSLLGSAEEDWSYETLTATINANHGYVKESEAIKRLINILISFNQIERRTFLQFLTGAPKLPIGGFKALRPEFTVVKKSAEDGLRDDDYLPSVMTCANYLKLPNYSSEEFMKERLLTAVNEGAGAFLLS